MKIFLNTPLKCIFNFTYMKILIYSMKILYICINIFLIYAYILLLQEDFLKQIKMMSNTLRNVFVNSNLRRFS